MSIEDEYKKVFNKLINEYNYRSHETSTCGLHIHVTKPKNEEIIDRIILFMETYKEEIIKLSRRDKYEIANWCQFLSDIHCNENKDIIKSLEYIKKNKDYHSKMLALNLQHDNTIEFRIFKGTLNFKSFMSCIEFVNNLVTLASDLNLPINKMTWTNVTKSGKYLPKYIKEHDLTSNKTIKDFTRIIILKRNKKRKDLLKNSIELYKNIVKEINILTSVNFDKKFVTSKMLDSNKIERYSSYLSSLKRNITTLKTSNLKLTDYELNRIESDNTIIQRNTNYEVGN